MQINRGGRIKTPAVEMVYARKGLVKYASQQSGPWTKFVDENIRKDLEIFKEIAMSVLPSGNPEDLSLVGLWDEANTRSYHGPKKDIKKVIRDAIFSVAMHGGAGIAFNVMNMASPVAVATRRVDADKLNNFIREMTKMGEGAYGLELRINPPRTPSWNAPPTPAVSSTEVLAEGQLQMPRSPGSPNQLAALGSIDDFL